MSTSTKQEKKKLRVAVIGYTGTIGKAVIKELETMTGVEIITAGRSSGDFRVDIQDTKSIAAFYKAAKQLDAVMCCTGKGYFGGLADCTKENLEVGWQNKLGGQMDLVLQGMHVLQDGGVFILTTGFLSSTPVRGLIGLSVVNAAVDAFVRTAPIELPRGLRINSVSPGFVTESAYSESIRQGLGEVSAKRVAKVYRRALVSGVTGKNMEITASGSTEK